jgi:glucokinase
MRIGIDIGGTTIIGGVVDKNQIVKKIKIPTDSHQPFINMFEKLISLIHELSSGYNIESVGMGIPGVFSSDGKKVVRCPNLNWKSVNLGEMMEQRLAVPVLMCNDATAATLAEHAYGAAAGCNNTVMLTIGTGIGGGIIINNKMIIGAHGVATEVGHMYISPGTTVCGCGKTGCLETFASANALVRYVIKGLENNHESLLYPVIKNEYSKINGKLIFEYSLKGDKLCQSAVNSLIKYLCIGISNIVDILDPELFVIGGGISNAGDILLRGIQNKLPTHLTYPELAVPEIKLAHFQNNAGLIGASLIQDYL